MARIPPPNLPRGRAVNAVISTPVSDTSFSDESVSTHVCIQTDLLYVSRYARTIQAGDRNRERRESKTRAETEFARERASESSESCV